VTGEPGGAVPPGRCCRRPHRAMSDGYWVPASATTG